MIAEELRALAERVPAGGPPAVTLARQRAVGAAGALARSSATFREVECPGYATKT